MRTPLAQPLLFGALRIGNAKVVRELLAEGADPNEPDAERQMPPLMWAAERGWALCAQILLAAGANINARDRSKTRETTLIRCCKNSQHAFAQAMLEAGADPDARSASGETALMAAAQAGSSRCVRALLAAGADPHLTDLRGVGALARAVGAGSEGCAVALALAGADPAIKDDAGRCAWDAARDMPQTGRAMAKAWASREATEMEAVSARPDANEQAGAQGQASGPAIARARL